MKVYNTVATCRRWTGVRGVEAVADIEGLKKIKLNAALYSILKAPLYGKISLDL
jgi:hypothetical protein